MSSNRAQKTGVILTIIVFLTFCTAIGVSILFINNSEITNNKTTITETAATPSVSNTQQTSDISVTPKSPVSTKIKTTIRIPSGKSTQTPTAPNLTTQPKETVAGKNYQEFVSTLLGETEANADVPVRIRGITILKDEKILVILNLSAKIKNDALRSKQVNTVVTGGFAQAIAHHDTGKIGGAAPEQLRIAEINNTDYSSKTLYLNTSLARKYYIDQINAMEFTDRYWNSERNMTKSEIELVKEVDKNAGNVTYNTND